MSARTSTGDPPVVKGTKEALSPTRVKLTVEVPFEELKPNLDAAYKALAQQVRIPGFRPGRAPTRVLDQRFGRGYVLDQAVNEARLTPASWIMEQDMRRDAPNPRADREGDFDRLIDRGLIAAGA